MFGWKENNQSDFSIDHLVMSRYRVFFCVVGRGCLLGLDTKLKSIFLGLYSNKMQLYDFHGSISVWLVILQIISSLLHYCQSFLARACFFLFLPVKSHWPLPWIWRSERALPWVWRSERAAEKKMNQWFSLKIYLTKTATKRFGGDETH